MNLQELNENYNEYLLTEEYLVEGLKIFKKSTKLYKFANKIDKKVIKLRDKNKSEDVQVAQKLSKEVKKLADEYKAVEDAFASKELDRNTAKTKLTSLKKHNDTLLTKIKSDQTKSAMKKIGLGLLVGGLAAGVAAVAINPGLIQAAGAAAGKGVATLQSAMAKAGTAVSGKVAELTGRGATEAAAATTTRNVASASEVTSRQAGSRARGMAAQMAKDKASDVAVSKSGETVTRTVTRTTGRGNPNRYRELQRRMVR